MDDVALRSRDHSANPAQDFNQQLLSEVYKISILTGKVDMRLNKVIDNLEKSFWLIPLLFAVFPFIIFYSVYLFAEPDNKLNSNYDLIINAVGNPDAARLILGTIAAAVISIVSISFSITVLVLSIASQQYSPRLLQNFMRKNDTKIILGIFISTFIYCLIALGLMPRDSTYDPALMILAFIGFIFGLISLLAFMYFVNYVIQTISLTNIIKNIQDDIISSFKKFFPENEDKKGFPSKSDGELHLSNSIRQLILFSPETGYLQSINYSELADLAGKNDYTFRLLNRTGEYVLEGSALLEIYGNNPKIDESIISSIQNQFVFGEERKSDGDILFPVSQMVDIAVKALSPGINDPRTAINCMDSLAKTLVFMSKRTLMSSVIAEDKKIRLIRLIYTYDDLVKACFRNVFDNARSTRLVLEHLVYVISCLIKIPSSSGFREALVTEANIIRLHNSLTDFDNKELKKLYSDLDIPIIEI